MNRAASLLLAMVATGWSLPVTAASAAGPTIACDTATPAVSRPAVAGPIRWGINPRVQAGQVGLEQPAVASVDAQQLATLGTLSGGSASRAGGAPFVLRLNRIFFPARPGQEAALAKDIAMYGGAGYLLELQLRFHPADLAPNVPDRLGGDPAAFAAWAAELVHTFDANTAWSLSRSSTRPTSTTHLIARTGSTPGRCRRWCRA